MNHTYILQPFHSTSSEILKCFASEKPLTADQINFLEWHYHQLSSTTFDPILKYYLAAEKKRRSHRTSFLLPHEKLNQEDIQKLKKRLSILLSDEPKRIIVDITQKQFLEFKKLLTSELIFWHGNQTLTGAPFFPGGIPPVILFQWGNLFGVVKYVIIAGEKALNANVLVYFESMQNRTLQQCVNEYELKLENEFQDQKKILHQHQVPIESFDKFLIKPPVHYETPRLSL